MALRSGQLVMIADTCNDHQLSIDAYINAHQVRTVLASCIAVQGRTIGLIYLENHQARHATSRNSGTPVTLIRSPTQRMGDALNALRP